MTEDQLKEWLGVADVQQPLRSEIVAGMVDVPMPDGDQSQLAAFTEFLKYSGPLGSSLWQRKKMRWRGYDGALFDAPYTTAATGQAYGYTHQLIMPALGQVIPPVTWCGRAIYGLPGSEAADCPDCLKISVDGMS